MGVVLNLIKRDVVLAVRNKMILYMLVLPVLLAVGALFFIPSVDATQMTFAVDSSISQDYINKLEDYGRVERMRSYEALQKRVLQPDDVPGLSLQNKNFQVVLEGNESQAIQELPATVIQYIQSDGPALETRIESLQVEKSNVRDLLTVIIVLNCVIMGGAVMGLTLVDEKESKGIEAVAVSPVSMKEYLLAKCMMAMTYVCIASVICLLILQGLRFHIAGLIPVMAVSVLFGLAFGFIIGAYTNNQVSAMALLKGLSFVAIAVPVVSWFVADRLQWLFYGFPNYWLFRLFKAVFIDFESNYIGIFLVSLIMNVIPLMLLLPVMRKRLKLR